ncbi:MAG TPA: RNA polymerase sigma factor [Bacteroidetes bacterium]|nr:RNA polymerase sigma factor [Bacteroidota bacterium]
MLPAEKLYVKYVNIFRVNDFEVIEKVLAGDREAFSLLINRHKDMAYTMAFRMVGNHSDAEEITQEAFIKAYSKLGFFRKDSTFSTWFYRIVFNGAVSYLRSRKNIATQNERTIQNIVSEEPLHQETEEQDFRRKAVLWVISQLNPVEQAIVTLFYHEEKSLKEIGKIVGMNEDTVKMRLHRSRKKMKELLIKKFKEEFANAEF